MQASGPWCLGKEALGRTQAEPSGQEMRPKEGGTKPRVLCRPWDELDLVPREREAAGG